MKESRDGESSDRDSSEKDLYAQIHELVTARILGELTPEQFQRLEKLLAANSEARRLYLCYIQETLAVRAIVGSGHEAEGPSSPVAARPVVARRSPMAGFLRKAGRRYRRLRGDTRYAVAMALCLAFVLAGVGTSVVVGVLALVRSFDLPNGQTVAVQPDAPQPPPLVARLTHVVNSAWAGETTAPTVGDSLTAGRKLDLKSGLAEITFEDGARAILEGPATLVVQSRSGAVLDHGKCAFTVKHPLARGFEINTPGMKYTDLGTEFGVLVAQNGEQEVHVFRGKVRAEEAASGEHGAGSMQPALRSPRRAPRSMLLTAHEAIRVASLGKPIERIAADEQRFVRTMVEPFSIFGSGVGLDRGAPDPHWEITAISTEAPTYKDNKIGKPQPAVVAVPDGSYTPDNRDKAQWISNSASKDNMPPSCRWTLLTHFDLSGFDPATARIEGQVSVDNFVVGIRVNGKAVSVPPVNRDEELFRRWLPLTVEEGFVAGDNTLEIVIENGDGIGPGNPQPSASPMALCLELKGLARRSPNLKAEQEAK